MDKETQLKFIDYLYIISINKIVIISTHNKDIIEICNEIIELK